jgi:hypothetical protein
MGDKKSFFAILLAFALMALALMATTTAVGAVKPVRAAFLARGSFVIADTNAATGTQVTFWGAQWAKKNAPSGGPAPSSFKGFADNLQTTPPACGQTWTSLPGNSSKPPKGPLPAFMEIIVSSSVTKHGRTISGNIVEIVTVKVAHGFAANPGHAGTGVVVGKIC